MASIYWEMGVSPQRLSALNLNQLKQLKKGLVNLHQAGVDVALLCQLGITNGAASMGIGGTRYKPMLETLDQEIATKEKEVST